MLSYKAGRLRRKNCKERADLPLKTPFLQKLEFQVGHRFNRKRLTPYKQPESKKYDKERIRYGEPIRGVTLSSRMPRLIHLRQTRLLFVSSIMDELKVKVHKMVM